MMTGEGGGEWRVEISLLKPKEAHGGSKVEGTKKRDFPEGPVV